MRVIVFVLMMFSICVNVHSKRLDCCLPAYSSTGLGCETDTIVGGLTYTCVKVPASCAACQLNSTALPGTALIASASCSMCCATSPNVCIATPSVVTTSSWTLILLVFAGSCMCCSVIFLSAEQSRIKEGITFQEAYLLPIPLVQAELNFSDKDYIFPPDQPTSIARMQTTIDITVAEPTEYSSLISRNNMFAWDDRD